MNHAMVSEVLYLCYWHSQESSPSVQDSLKIILPDGNMAYMSVYTCILPVFYVLYNHSCSLWLFNETLNFEL